MYGAGIIAARTLSAVAPASESKLWRSLRARRGLVSRLVRRTLQVRDGARPLVWLHAPSVGEGLQARPVAHALRAANPHLQLAYTYFSPSAVQFAPSIGAEITDYLPFDGVAEAEAVLDALAPAVLVFVKLDVWPNLVQCAQRRGIPVALISATLAEQSGRRSRLSQWVLRDAYAALSAVGAIDEQHAARLVAFGARREVTSVTGDTRFDQVAARAEHVDRTSPLLRALASTRFTLVAGSTWPDDERVLLPAWLDQRASPPMSGSASRLIIAPHEPSAAHVEPLLRWSRDSGLSVVTLSSIESPTAGAADLGTYASADVIVVDRVGVLGDLYALADAAFVGGGFHRAGLHSVIEPAAFGAPVAFGPAHTMSREAGLLIAAGGGVSVDGAPALAKLLAQWSVTPTTGAAAGEAARRFVHSELGATLRSTALVESLFRAH